MNLYHIQADGYDSAYVEAEDVATAVALWKNYGLDADEDPTEDEPDSIHRVHDGAVVRASDDSQAKQLLRHTLACAGDRDCETCEEARRFAAKAP